MHHIDWNVLALGFWMGFVTFGAFVAVWHTFIAHAEKRRQYNPQEARLFDLMRAQEHTQSRRVRKALGSRAVLPRDWKETG